jgi:hypothetical protein
VRHIRGIKGVTNLIQLKPQDVAASEIKRKIEEAFRRSAEIDANRITVEMNGGEVILRGSVRTWPFRDPGTFRDRKPRFTSADAENARKLPTPDWRSTARSLDE